MGTALLLSMGGACAAQPIAAAPERSARMAPGSAAAATYGRRDDVLRLAFDLARTHELDPEWVASTLSQARRVPAVMRLIMPAAPGQAKSWQAYRERFIEPRRIQAGLAFWDAHEPLLERVRQRFGVPPELVVGIIGVETFYGKHRGGFRVLDALATLSLDFPTGRSDRSAFFRDELGHFLVWARREALAPTAVKGSYAGAIGLGQFMPGSILRHAIDFDGDGHVDMGHSAADVIGSIANFLVNHGWLAHEPTDFRVQAPTDPQQLAALLAPDIEPTFSAAQFAEHGARLDDGGSRYGGPMALVELHNGNASPSYVAGTRNFQVVTMYNRSAYYALAVIELGRAVADRRALRTVATGDAPR